MYTNVKTSLNGIWLANLHDREMIALWRVSKEEEGYSRRGIERGRGLAGRQRELQGDKDGASAFTQAGGHERGGDRKVRG